METKLSVWLVEALGLENLKIQIMAGVNSHVDQLCAVSLPALGIPVSVSLSADIKSNLNDLIEKASFGALDPDGKIGRLIEISESLIMKDYRGRTRAFLKKRIPEKHVSKPKDGLQGVENSGEGTVAKDKRDKQQGAKSFENKMLAASKWTRPRKLLYGRVGDHRNFATEKAIAQAETELYSMTFCLGILAEIKHMYDRKGIMKRLMLLCDANNFKDNFKKDKDKDKDKQTETFFKSVAPRYGLRWDPRSGEDAIREEIKLVNTDFRKESYGKKWNQFMPRLTEVLEELKLAQGDVLATLKIFQKLQFAEYLTTKIPPDNKFESRLTESPDGQTTFKLVVEKDLPDKKEQALYRAEGSCCYLPPLAKPENKHEEARLARAMNMGTILANLQEAVIHCAEAAAERYAKAVAPGVLAVFFHDGLGLDVDPPSKSVERLTLALKDKLSKYCKLLGSRHQADFSKVFEQVEEVLKSQNKGENNEITSIAGMCMNDLLVHGPIRDGILAWLSDSSSSFILNQLVKESLYDLLSQNLRTGSLGAIGTKIAGDTSRPSLHPTAPALSRACLCTRFSHHLLATATPFNRGPDQQAMR